MAHRPIPAIPACLVFVALLALARPSAAAPAAQDAELGAERDALILKIFRGQDVAASVGAYKQLYERHQRLVDAQSQAQSRQAARNAELEVYQKTSLDYAAGWSCRLSAEPPPNDYRTTDWGRVVRKVDAPIDAGAQGGVVLGDSSISIYEIEGREGRRFVTPKEDIKQVIGVGDLVIACHFSERTRAELVPPWNTVKLSTAAHFGRIAEPPRIVTKSRWNPVHITDQELRNAIQAKRWEVPPSRSVVALVRVDQQLGGGRYAMLSRYWADPFVLEVDPALPRRDLLQPGEFVWVIMSSPRFDKELDKLVLKAADIELRYLIER